MSKRRTFPCDDHDDDYEQQQNDRDNDPNVPAPGEAP
jgi:hypothetical protein